MLIAHWHWPQWTILGFQALGWLISANLSGNPRTGKHSFIATVIGSVGFMYLLYCGGFFQ